MSATTQPSIINMTEEVWTISVNRSEEEGGDWLQYGGGLPPGWTLEGIQLVVMLLKIRLGIGYVGVICNLLAFAVQIKLQSYRKTQFMFGFVLTVAEFSYVTGVLVETHYYYLNIQPVPKVWGALVLASNMLAFLSIIAVGIDRYFALCAFPLKYKILVTTQRYAPVIVVLLLFCGVYGFVFTRFFESTGFIVPLRGFVILSVCLAVSTTVYVVIAIKLKYALKELTLPESIKKTRVQQTKRLMMAFSLILITNGICYMPHSFFGLWLALKPIDQRYNLLHNIITGNVLYNIRTLNSTFNPLIYWSQVLVREIPLPDRCKSTT